MRRTSNPLAVDPDLGEPKGPESCSAVQFGACSEPADVLSPLQLVPAGTKDGRRIYVHADSFDDLAARQPSLAPLIYEALSSLPALKLVHHDLVEEAVALDLIEACRAQLLERAITSLWTGTISRALRAIGATVPGSPAAVPLLTADEIVVATCLDSNYFTFATTENAARRMYADVLRLREVRRLVLQGGDAYRDLTMVRGRRLVYLRVPTPSNKGASDPSESDTTAQSAESLGALKQQTLARFAQDLESVIVRTLPDRGERETRVLEAYYEKCVTTVGRTILHCAGEPKRNMAAYSLPEKPR
jgi:hypothetical protein